MTAIDYDREAVRPTIGSLWVWEPQRAPELVMVHEVFWNGEQWWVATISPRLSLLPSALLHTQRGLNELSRFWEACHAVVDLPGPRGAHTRRGAPRPEELKEAG